MSARQPIYNQFYLFIDRLSIGSDWSKRKWVANDIIMQFTSFSICLSLNGSFHLYISRSVHSKGKAHEDQSSGYSLIKMYFVRCANKCSPKLSIIIYTLRSFPCFSLSVCGFLYAIEISYQKLRSHFGTFISNIVKESD